MSGPDNAHKYAQGQPEHLSGNQMFKYPILVVRTLSPRRGPGDRVSVKHNHTILIHILTSI